MASISEVFFVASLNGLIFEMQNPWPLLFCLWQKPRKNHDPGVREPSGGCLCSR